jgi:ABC-type transport system involved in cytochrome c biogenesis permease subunit
LQSTWLHIHVTFAMFAYAACAISFALALLYLIKDRTSTNTFLWAVSAFITIIYSALLTRLDPHGGLLVSAWDIVEKREIYLAERTPLMVSLPGLGYLFAIVLAVSLLPLLLVIFARAFRARRSNIALEVWARRVFVVSTLLQIVALAGFILRAKTGSYYSVQVGAYFSTRLSASPFLVAGMASALFASALMLLLLWRRPTIESILPEPNKIDLLTYKTIAVAFPLLTVMIATGAYWANRTWGSYWSWDPKETWALITWLVYAGYLHARLVHGWRGRRAAYLAIIGFAVVIFTFFGVSYLLPGLHAYA